MREINERLKLEDVMTIYITYSTNRTAKIILHIIGPVFVLEIAHILYTKTRLLTYLSATPNSIIVTQLYIKSYLMIANLYIQYTAHSLYYIDIDIDTMVIHYSMIVDSHLFCELLLLMLWRNFAKL